MIKTIAMKMNAHVLHWHVTMNIVGYTIGFSALLTQKSPPRGALFDIVRISAALDPQFKHINRHKIIENHQINFDLILILYQVSKHSLSESHYETFFNNSFDHWIKWRECNQSSPIIRCWYLCWWFTTAWLWSHWLEPYWQWGFNCHRPFQRSSGTGTFPTKLFRNED